MKFQQFLLLIALPALLLAAMAGCATSRGHLTSLAEVNARAEGAGFPADQIPVAAHLYAAKCANCHKFYDPANYSEEEWQTWMRKMARKAKLQSDEEQLLSRFLAVARGTNSMPPDH